jgi:hypothetical protein
MLDHDVFERTLLLTNTDQHLLILKHIVCRQRCGNRYNETTRTEVSVTKEVIGSQFCLSQSDEQDFPGVGCHKEQEILVAKRPRHTANRFAPIGILCLALQRY